jgi:CspA family cold shock protein
MEQVSTVKWFSGTYGFIRRPEPDGSGDDIFVHFSAIQSEGYRTLTEGQRVAYEPHTTAKGTQALNVRVLGP